MRHFRLLKINGDPPFECLDFNGIFTIKLNTLYKHVTTLGSLCHGMKCFVLMPLIPQHYVLQLPNF